MEAIGYFCSAYSDPECWGGKVPFLSGALPQGKLLKCLLRSPSKLIHDWQAFEQAFDASKS